jgi:acetyl esterase/lipase
VISLPVTSLPVISLPVNWLPVNWLPWLFLAVALLGLGLTVNAVRPWPTLWPRIGLGFFPAWLTSELALHQLVAQASVALAFVAFGALHAWPGQAGAALALLSCGGLATLFLGSLRDGARVRASLKASIGELDDLRGPDGEPLRWGLEPRQLLFPFWMKEPGVERLRNIPYIDDGRSRHRLDIYRPLGGAKRAPVMLQIHGGGWVVGDKAQQGQLLVNRLAAAGWVCAAINYRLGPKDTWPAQIIDCKRALAWVREHIAEYGGDPDFVVVTGGSAGGHLCSLLALTPNEPRFQPGFEDADTSVQGFVPFYGVYDWTNRFGTRGRLNRFAMFLEQLVVKQRLSDAPEVFDDASPMSHVDGDIPPVLVFHGTNDSLAPVEDARHFVHMLEERSKDTVVYIELPGAHHAFEVFASVRAMHAIRGVEAFAAWLAANRHQRA